MSTVKTAISIDEIWFKKAEQIATEMKISRSRLFMLAIQQLIEDYEARKITENLNEVYSDYTPLPEDTMFAQKMRERQRNRTAESWQ